ncbi:MAG TPA: HAD family hydrolase [Patescibacteria group bacterium]|nr:HAD family hydrolase [Patescibacteria group bacterium]
MKKNIRFILIDIDDCLLPTDGRFHLNYFTGLPEVAHCVKKAERGEIPPIGFCTGRDRNYVEAVAFSLLLPNSWSIIESGISLFNPFTKEMLLNPMLTPEIEEAFRRIKQERLPQILNKFPGLFNYPGNIINIALERRNGMELDIEECYEAVAKEFDDLVSQDLVTIHHSNSAVDISPQGIDKAAGIKFLAEKTGITPAQMLGIGDSRGDFPMLRIVGSSGCPSNASEECKKLIGKKGGYISPHQYAKGVADVLDHYFNKG